MTAAPPADPDDLGPDWGLGDLLLGVDHVGIAVAELEPALAWWTGTLGLRVAHREENHDQQVVEVMLSSEPGTSSRPATQLQLLAPLSEESAVARFLSRRGPGLQHVAFVVRDLDLAMSRLADRGSRLLYPEARVGTSGSKINFIHPRDSGGVLVELVEPGSFAGLGAAEQIESEPATRGPFGE